MLLNVIDHLKIIYTLTWHSLHLNVVHLAKVLRVEYVIDQGYVLRAGKGMSAE